MIEFFVEVREPLLGTASGYRVEQKFGPYGELSLARKVEAEVERRMNKARFYTKIDSAEAPDAA